MEKDSKKMRKRDARILYNRLYLFQYFLFRRQEGKTNLFRQLVGLCHDVLSECDLEIFNKAGGDEVKERGISFTNYN